MKAIVIGSTKHLFFAVFYASLGIVLALLVAGIWFLNSRPELSIWHTTHLDSEYHQELTIADFDAYMTLEQKLVAELEQKIYFETQHTESSSVNRYLKHSLSDPSKWAQNWNLSYEWPLDNASFGVLLLHGMSDSPYSLSNIAQHLKGKAHVLGLRLPGHGTVPSGLIDIRWQDMAGAVELATSHLKNELKGKPLFVVGFSTGAALALNHELERIARSSPVDYRGMIMISPAIGLPPIAAGARWQSWLGKVLALDKLEWNSIQVEYDPFKYRSFAVNAGDIVYRLTNRNERLMAAMTLAQLSQIPPVLTFQSVIDDTVSSTAVVTGLYQRLPQHKHELVLFDINRIAFNANANLMLKDPLTGLQPSLTQKPLNYRATIIENREGTYTDVVARELGYTSCQAQCPPTIVPLSLSWPAHTYSLSHVALPFPVSDSLYGQNDTIDLQRIQLGDMFSRGERGLFSVSAAEMLRQKWNPFFPYMLSRMDEYLAKHNNRED